MASKVYRNGYIKQFEFYGAGPSSLGVPCVPWHTQYFADQLTLFQPGGDRLCSPNYYCGLLRINKL